MNKRVLLGGAFLGGLAVLAGCGRQESWSDADKQSLAAVAARAAQGAGESSHKAVNQGKGVTSAGAYSVIIIAQSSELGQSGQALTEFANNLSSLGVPIDLKTQCIQPEAGKTLCTGPYGDVTITPSSIKWVANRATIVGVAQKL
jgi:hypothetical protein